MVTTAYFLSIALLGKAPSCPTHFLRTFDACNKVGCQVAPSWESSVMHALHNRVLNKIKVQSGIYSSTNFPESELTSLDTGMMLGPGGPALKDPLQHSDWRYIAGENGSRQERVSILMDLMDLLLELSNSDKLPSPQPVPMHWE